MKTRVLWLISAVLFFSFVGNTDEPPSWREFTINSENGICTAEIRVKDKKGLEKPWQWDYKITVYKIEDESKAKLWSCDYDYGGYPGGRLSDDGSAFAYVDTWYSTEHPVVFVYHNGVRKTKFSGKDFRIDPSRLLKTVSHQLWLNQDGFRYGFVSSETRPLALEIHTIDGKKHLIDVETGKFIENRSKESPRVSGTPVLRSRS
jgi:hypothetical protein